MCIAILLNILRCIIKIGKLPSLLNILRCIIKIGKLPSLSRSLEGNHRKLLILRGSPCQIPIVCCSEIKCKTDLLSCVDVCIPFTSVLKFIFWLAIVSSKRQYRDMNQNRLFGIKYNLRSFQGSLFVLFFIFLFFCFF